jgi:hypothetical protein
MPHKIVDGKYVPSRMSNDFIKKYNFLIVCNYYYGIVGGSKTFIDSAILDGININSIDWSKEQWIFDDSLFLPTYMSSNGHVLDLSKVERVADFYNADIVIIYGAYLGLNKKNTNKKRTYVNWQFSALKENVYDNLIKYINNCDFCYHSFLIDLDSKIKFLPPCSMHKNIATIYAYKHIKNKEIIFPCGLQDVFQNRSNQRKNIVDSLLMSGIKIEPYGNGWKNIQGFEYLNEICKSKFIMSHNVSANDTNYKYIEERMLLGGMLMVPVIAWTGGLVDLCFISNEDYIGIDDNIDFVNFMKKVLSVDYGEYCKIAFNMNKKCISDHSAINRISQFIYDHKTKIQ